MPFRDFKKKGIAQHVWGYGEGGWTGSWTSAEDWETGESKIWLITTECYFEYKIKGWFLKDPSSWVSAASSFEPLTGHFVKKKKKKRKVNLLANLGQIKEKGVSPPTNHLCLKISLQALVQVTFPLWVHFLMCKRVIIMLSLQNYCEVIWA